MNNSNPSPLSYLHPIFCGVFGFLSTIIGSYFFSDLSLSLYLVVGVALFLISNQLMLKFQFNSYNTNGATITTVLVFAVQAALIAVWSRQQIGIRWIIGIICIAIGVILLKGKRDRCEQKQE